MTLERGALLNKRYRMLEILGQGGMGSIYRAVDENLGVNVAVKENMFTTEEYARQFRREAVILASLRHPNLPRVTDHFVIEGQGQYLIMDYIEGEDLRERLDREVILPDEDVVILGAAICDALNYLHTRSPQIVHRDIKPGNVKITPSGQIILVDFGLAKVIHGSQATTTGARAMTPGYSPPEQYGTARTDHRTDLYSLGATLYVAATGVIPEDALARAMEQADLTPVRKINSKVSKRLAGVIEKALEMHPEDRFQSAEQFKRALLNTRVITGQRQREMTIPPSPVSDSIKTSRSNGDQEIAVSGANQIESSSQPAGAQSGLLPTSSPLGGSSRRPAIRARRRRKLGCWLISLYLLGIALLASLGVYAFQPWLFKEALTVLTNSFPALGLPRLPASLTPSPPAPQTDIAMSASPTPELEPTATLAPVLSGTLTATPRLTPTHTPLPTLTPTLAPTAVGGGSGQIAFVSDVTGLPQIWLMSVDGTEQRQISDMPEGACQPAWSPDGLRLVFISPCAFNQETYPGASLFIINADGAGLQPLPTMPGGDFDPAWSPDGTRIAFTSLRDYNRAQIYAINLADNQAQSLSANKVRDAQPSWSPDGQQIVFVSTRRGPYQIWTMGSDGRDQTIFSRSGSLKNTHPIWSPDGQVILFTQSEVLGGVPRLIAARFSGGPFNENRVIKEIIPMREATYSPDGFWLAYESWPDGLNHAIYVMTSNGLARQLLTSDSAFEFDPVWRPRPGQP